MSLRRCSFRHLFRVVLAAICLVAVSPTSARAQLRAAGARIASSSGLWQEVDEKSTLATHGTATATLSRLDVVPRSYRVLHLDRTKLAAAFASALPEGTLRRALAAGAPAAALPAPAEIELPIPRSTAFARFSVEESPVMDPALAARYPDIKTYIAQGIDHPEFTARLDVTPLGFHALIFSPGGQIYVDPYFLDGSDPSTSIAYYKRDFTSLAPMPCLFHSQEAAAAIAEKIARATSPVLSKPTGASLRVYRLVVGTTAEYAAAVGGGDVTLTLGAVVTTINRVDLVYEKDFAIRMVLVANEDKMIFTNVSTEPYTNSNSSSLLTQNKTQCNNIIGTANYDIGHVFSTAGGGLASLGVVCGTNKAQGETGTSNPIGDPYDIDYVAHEMGHQFGANHTFNSTTNNCGGGNRNASTAYEPGSGTTIMAYAGICSTSTSIQDLAPHSDDYFHTVSYDEIDAYTTTGTGKNVVLPTIATGNTPPTVSTPTAYTIPISTPFTLTAAATDPDGDTLTYCWEEFDKGAAVNATATSGLDNGASPIFRSYAPTTSPTRTFPSLAYILNNANVPPLTGTVDGNYLVGEALPNQARSAGLSFRCTVRDNHAGGGGSNYALVTLTVAAGAGPFAVTAPNSTGLSYAAGATIPVTWNVANTTASPVSCANVKISLSTDGGQTFPYVLASSVPNSGSANVTLPIAASVATVQARLKIEAVGNIFFDINDNNFTITSANTPPAFSANSSGITVTRGTPTAVTATVGTATAGTNPLSSVTVTGAPVGATVTGALNGNNVQLTASAACRLTTTLSTRSYPLTVTVTDSAGATSSGTVNLLVAPNPSPTLGNYTATSVPAGNTVTVTPSAGPTDANGNLLSVPLSISPTTVPPTGMTVTINQATGALTVATTSSTAQATSTLRVQVQDTCGATVERAVAVTVTAPAVPPTFTSSVPSTSATAGAAYSYTFSANGSPAPTFALTAGTLPQGLSLNPTTGVLSGTPTVAGVSSGLQVTASNGTLPNATQSFSLTVNDSASHYFAAAGLTGGNALPGADPDGDGLSNLIEYALNLNPAQPDAGSSALPGAQTAVRSYRDGLFLSIRFTRVPLATDISYIVESSADLATWTTVASSSGGSVLTGPGVVTDDTASTVPHEVEVRDTVANGGTGGQRRFLRLRITQP